MAGSSASSKNSSSQLIVCCVVSLSTPFEETASFLKINLFKILAPHKSPSPQLIPKLPLPSFPPPCPSSRAQPPLPHLFLIRHAPIPPAVLIPICGDQPAGLRGFSVAGQGKRGVASGAGSVARRPSHENIIRESYNTLPTQSFLLQMKLLLTFLIWRG